ncbi:hypothetical protein F0562_013667 [Nyssa sinensis]|uniref:Uncharacterized protein n=1 Tax=Nyssa sinensis TaxID=561372 RepID=A0A5J4ZQQ4_9ASTE|nr:hypothetical protein F0562_013667 [Nyssa sinensis]
MDYSVIVPKAKKKAEMQIATPQGEEPSPLDGYIGQLDQLSRIRRMKNVDLIQSRCVRLNFRDHYDDNYYMYGPHGPPPSSSSIPPGSSRPPPPQPPRYMQRIPLGSLRSPPPPPRYMMQGPHSPPPGPPPPPPSPPPSYHYYLSEPPHRPPPPRHGYPPCDIFSDENPNGCTVM